VRRKERKNKRRKDRNKQTKTEIIKDKVMLPIPKM